MGFSRESSTRCLRFWTKRCLKPLVHPMSPQYVTNHSFPANFSFANVPYHNTNCLDINEKFLKAKKTPQFVVPLSPWKQNLFFPASFKPSVRLLLYVEEHPSLSRSVFACCEVCQVRGSNGIIEAMCEYYCNVGVRVPAE